jgi:Family of unknown function (DUF6665)
MSRDFHLHRTPLDVLDYEILQEQAAALGRMGRALEAALAKLREFDVAHPCTCAPASAQQSRRTLVIEAGHALWMFVVQREACGLRNSHTVMHDYNVPREVQQRMGPPSGDLPSFRGIQSQSRPPLFSKLSSSEEQARR